MNGDDTRPDEPVPEPLWVVGTAVFYVPFAAGALLWLAHRGEVWARTVGEAPGRDLLLGLALGLAVVGATRALARWWSGVDRMARGLGQVLGELSFTACCVLALLSGITEELVFRAALQPEIGPVWATLAFAAVHLPFHRDLRLWPVFALVVGALLAVLFEWTGAALAPAAAHVVINAINLRWIAVQWGGGGRGVHSS